MNLLKTAACCVLLLCGAPVFAQITPHPTSINAGLKKLELFNDLPSRMLWNRQAVAQLLEKEVGAHVDVPLTPGFIFSGTVISKSDARDTRSKTVVIKSSNRPGAALTLTRIKKEDGSFKYSGRMLSLAHSDAYELVKEGDGFELQKRRLDDLVSE
jgi:hypothetical protein